MSFTKEHLRNPENINDLKCFHKIVLKKYSSLINTAKKNDYDFAVKFLSWLNQYHSLFINEKNFDSSFLPSYKRGQIVLINLGYRIGFELGGAHYGIVLNSDSRKKSGLITVIPLVSKKVKHMEKGLRPWEFELPFPISTLLIIKAATLLSQVPDNDKILNIMKSISELSVLSQREQQKRGQYLLDEFQKLIPSNIDELIALSIKMHKGSVVDTQQIITVSKQRIITPTKRTHPLYDVIIPPKIMQDIDKLIKKNFFSEID